MFEHASLLKAEKKEFSIKEVELLVDELAAMEFDGLLKNLSQDKDGELLNKIVLALTGYKEMLDKKIKEGLSREDFEYCSNLLAAVKLALVSMRTLWSSMHNG